MFHHGVDSQPRMPSGLVDRPCRWREGRLGKCADRHGNDICLCPERVEDRRAAVGAEMKGSLLALVGGSHVIAVTTDDAHLIRAEPCLDAEGASSPPLAGKTVTHGHPDFLRSRTSCARLDTPSTPRISTTARRSPRSRRG